jgi:protein-S-isoprenylcysteine O-methyltransferase Ste14
VHTFFESEGRMQQPDLILHLRQLTVCLWIVLIAVWLIGALRTKRTAWRQPHSARLEQMLLLVPGVYLLFARTQVPPALNQAIFPATLLPVSFGFLLALCGVGFSIWARMTLGTNWSSTVTLKDDHTLVRSGPYRLVRHPIYTGILFALAGSAFQAGLVRSFLGVALCIAGFWIKIRVEERLMMQHFGEQYIVYRREVKALVPFVF